MLDPKLRKRRNIRNREIPRKISMIASVLRRVTA